MSHALLEYKLEKLVTLTRQVHDLKHASPSDSHVTPTIKEVSKQFAHDFAEYWNQASQETTNPLTHEEMHAATLDDTLLGFSVIFQRLPNKRTDNAQADTAIDEAYELCHNIIRDPFLGLSLLESSNMSIMIDSPHYFE